MKAFREVWPDAKEGSYVVEDGPESYGDLIRSFGYEVLAEGHDDDYSGDSFYLLRDGERYGFLNFGWGSCSGCDAFEATTTVKEMDELRESLHSGIEWFDSQDAVLAFIADDLNHAHRYYVSDYGGGFKRFREAVTS